MSHSAATDVQLRLVFWNANGLQNKRHDLELFARHHALDVILVNETHLRAGYRANIPGYVLHRDDRTDRKGGGTAIYIKSGLRHYKEPTPVLLHAEVTSVVIELTDGEKIRAVSIYNPPNRLLLSTDLNLIFRSTIPTIVAGDFNSKHPQWNSSCVNRNGQVLFDYAQRRQLTVHIDAPSTPTFFHMMIPGYADVLDIAMFQNFQGGYAMENLYELSSDHNPILLVMNLSNAPLSTPTRTRTDWEKFRKTAERTISIPAGLNSAESLDSAVELFTKEVQEAVAENSTSVDPTKNPPVPLHIRQLVRERNRSRRYWQRLGNPSDKRELNRLDRELKAQMAELRNDQWTNKIATLSTDDNSIWKMAKSLRSTKETIPPIRRTDGTCAACPAEKAEAFADGLEEQFTPVDVNFDAEAVAKLRDETEAALRAHTDEELQRTNTTEIRACIARVKVNKASGPDQVSARALKSLPDKGILALTSLVNATLTLKHYPHTWKEAQVVLIRKPKTGGTKTSDYRPISLLSVAGKICERIIESRLRDSVDREKLLPVEQHGFRPKHSSVHQLMRVVEKINRGFSLKLSTGAIFLDVAKAFDKVWHDGLLHKLLAGGIPLPLCQLLDSYLQNRSFKVRTEGTLSSIRPIGAGVPQGSILGPLLFTCYTADIPIPEDRRAQIALYADDTAISFTSANPKLITTKLQQLCDILEKWFGKWRIQINPKKSAAVFFSRRPGKKSKTTGPISMFGETIPWVSETRYLGLVLDDKLTWKPHIEHVRAKAIGGMAALRPITGRRSKLSLKNKVLLYKTMIRPVMTYAAPVWAYARPRLIERLQVVQNRMMREAVDAPWFVRNADIRKDTNTQPIMEHMKDLSIRFHKTLPSVPNETIRDLCSSDDPYGNPHPRDILKYEPP
jgi:hypothetical protein